MAARMGKHFVGFEWDFQKEGDRDGLEGFMQAFKMCLSESKEIFCQKKATYSRSCSDEILAK